jgi:hypothetical protein
MTIRSKLYTGGLAIAVAWFVVTDFLPRETIYPSLVSLGAFGLAQWAFVRTFRCPNCGVRFDSRMFKTGIWYHSWLRRTCWNCGVDISECERQKAQAIKDNAPSS